MHRTHFFPLGDDRCIGSIATSCIHSISGTPDAWRYLAYFWSTSVFLVTGDAAKNGEEKPLCPRFNKIGERFRGFHLAMGMCSTPLHFIDLFHSSVYKRRLSISAIHHVHQDCVFHLQAQAEQGGTTRGGEPSFIPFIPFVPTLIFM